jgi:hypothetical protein
MSGSTNVKRGRPLKFGRPTQLVSLTIPTDVIAWLTGVDEDLAWALVKLHERSSRIGSSKNVQVAGLAQIPGDRALILVRPDHFDKLRGVSLIPLADGRAFLALEPTKGAADLELAVLDRLEEPTLGEDERRALSQLRALLQQWRREGILFESRSIVIAKRPRRAKRTRLLSPLVNRRL